MPCNLCLSDFGVFKKEVGCKTCGFSYCSKCCYKRSLVAGTGETYKQLVCNTCFTKLSEGKTHQATYSPPLAHKKRMEKFANRSVSLGTSSVENEKDREIAERLQKLKRERQKEALPSQVEIEERLAKLKGMDPSKYTAPPIQVYRPSDRRSSTEQATDLFKQIQEEVEIDEKGIKPEDEIAARLAHLKGEPAPLKAVHEDNILPGVYQQVQSSSLEEMDIEHENRLFEQQQRVTEVQALKEIHNLHKDSELKQVLCHSMVPKEKGSPSDSDLDEDAEADLIIEKLLAVNVDSNEVEDPDSLNGGNSQIATESKDISPNDDDTEEFPWCIICTEDAVIRCFGCDGDLYCMKCFRECHDSLNIKDHKTCPFLFPKA